MRAGPLLAVIVTASTLAGCAGISAPSMPEDLSQVFARGSGVPRATPAFMAAEPAPIPASVAAGDLPYTLDSGDKLRVTVFGQDGISNSYIVDAGGNVMLPLVGPVRARGLSSHALAAAITERLRAGFIREPHVAVEIESYRPFFILGEVTAPGQYPFVPNMTAETAVAIAGGFTPRALHGPVQISRTIEGQPTRTALPLTAAVRPGDTITVSERWF